MWKFLGRKLRSHRTTLTASGSSSEISGKFNLEKHCPHGFPLSPSCMTFDVYRRVLFIGTSSGEIRMLGQPGVELSGLHDDVNKVLQILPFTSEPSLITICSNNIMHKWSLVDHAGDSRLILRRTYKFQGGLAKTITTCCLPPHCDCLFVGTLGGITYPMDTEFDGMSPEVLSWSRARAYLKYSGKDVPGEVRTLEINPVNHKQLLIGYEHSYLELWDALTWKPISYFGAYKENETGDILSSSWHSSGNQFVTAHQDGTIAFWNVNSHSQPVKTKKPYGSERVQDMFHILWPEDDLLVVSGGSPFSLVDGHCATVLDHSKSHTLQLTSPIKGMHVLDGIQADRDSGIVNYGDTAEGEGVGTNLRVLILLLEQEVIFIELTFPELPILRPPYLYSIHNSPIKYSGVYEGVPKEVWQTITQAGRVQQEMVYRARSNVWPIDGGILNQTDYENRAALITGHEDGTVKIWDISGVSMRLLYSLKSSSFFNTFDSDFFDGGTPENESDVVKQIGYWDPRSDDDQLQVSCLQFYEEQLLVGFMGGISLLFSLNNQTSTVIVPLHRVSILREDPRQRGRNWQAPMELRLDGIECAPGYQPTFCVGIYPNVPITATGLAKEQKLIGVGCMYGFAIIDYLKNSTVHVSSTFTEADPDHGHLSRMQSIRKSFRQSLKRLNVRRSMRGGQSIHQSYRPALVRSGSTRPSTKNRAQAAKSGGGGIGPSPGASHEATPVAPRRDTVKSFTFSAPCQIAGHSYISCVLVGTNQGGVLAYTIDMPTKKERDSKSPVLMPCEREFSTRKNHAVLFCGVLDHQNYLLDINDPRSYHHSSSKGGQWIVIVTEDAVKVLGIPNLKKKFRLRLKQNDNDEFHVQSGHFIRMGGQSFVLLMCSDGFIHVYTLPDLKLIYREDCVDASDAFGQRHFIITPHGLLLHQKSPSEFTRGSLSDHTKVDLHFSIPCKDPNKVAPPPSTPKSIDTTPATPIPADQENLSSEEELQHSASHKESDVVEVEVSVEVEDIDEGSKVELLTANSSEDAQLDFQERAL